MTAPKLSPFVEYRLDRFDELVADKSYGAARAIKGLKNWKYSQAYRLTSFDNAVIDSRIRLHQTVKGAKR